MNLQPTNYELAFGQNYLNEMILPKEKPKKPALDLLIKILANTRLPKKVQPTQHELMFGTSYCSKVILPTRKPSAIELSYVMKYLFYHFGNW